MKVKIKPCKRKKYPYLNIQRTYTVIEMDTNFFGFVLYKLNNYDWIRAESVYEVKEDEQ